jgi:hypothetical protein
MSTPAFSSSTTSWTASRKPPEYSKKIPQRIRKLYTNRLVGRCPGATARVCGFVHFCGVSCTKPHSRDQNPSSASDVQGGEQWAHTVQSEPSCGSRFPAASWHPSRAPIRPRPFDSALRAHKCECQRPQRRVKALSARSVSGPSGVPFSRTPRRWDVMP